MARLEAVASSFQEVWAARLCSLFSPGEELERENCRGE